MSQSAPRPAPSNRLAPQPGAGFAAAVLAGGGVERVGEQLGPVVAARAAAEQGQRLRFGAGRAQCVEAVGERERDAFEHGVAEQRAIGRVVHAEEHALCVRVVVRRAFTGQIGQKERGGGQCFRRQCLDFGEQGRLVGRGELADPAQTTGRRQHHAHLMPAIRNCVAERVHRRRGVRPEAVADHAQHAGRAERHEAVTGLRRADADRARRVVATAGRDDHAVAQTELARHGGEQGAGGRAAFAQAGHLRARHVAGGEQRIRPVAFGHVEPQRARRVRWIGHLAARQLQAQVVLRQQHAGRARKDFRLVARHPEQLRRGESGHREIAGHAVQLWRALGQLGAFLIAAHVVPQ